MSDYRPIVENGTDLAMVRAAEPRGILMTPANRETIQAIAYDVFASGREYMPAHIKSEEQAKVVMYFGYEVGLPPMASLMNIYVVHGRPAMESKAMLALLRSRPDLGYFTWGDCNAQSATIVMHVNTPEGYVKQPFTFTMAQAQAAGLTKNALYKALPEVMLRWRVAAIAMRATFPDLLMGCSYAPEELGAPMRAVGTDGVEVDVDALATGELDALPTARDMARGAIDAEFGEIEEGAVDFEDSGGLGQALNTEPDPNEMRRSEIEMVVSERVAELVPPPEVPQWAIDIEVSTRREAAAAMGKIGLSSTEVRALGDLAIAQGHERGDEIWKAVSTWWAAGQLPGALYEALLLAAKIPMETNPFLTEPQEDDNPWTEEGE